MKTRRRKTMKLKHRKKPMAAAEGRCSAAYLQEQLDDRTRELRQAREQQSATAEILRIISRSTTDVQPVFEAIVRNFVSLCGSTFGAIYTFDGELLHFAGAHGFSPEQLDGLKAKYPVHVDDRSVLSSRAIRAKAPVHVQDTMSDPHYDRQHAALTASRRMLAMPMLREGVPLGAIVAAWAEAGATPKQHEELLSVFADQAVIAIENTRLLKELRDSLQQQTATAEVLKVISSSPGELEPVFQAMLENATRICEAKFGMLFRYEGHCFHMAASVNLPPPLADFMTRQGAFAPEPGRLFGRLTETKNVIQVVDRGSEPNPSPSFRYGGARSSVAVPMMKDNELIGALFIYRTEVRPFTDKQVELVQGFAAQAVIAIENTRLLNELRESSAADRDRKGLQVISTSTGELEPVFRAMLENATRICGAHFGSLWRFEDGAARLVSNFNHPPAFAKFLQQGPHRPGPHNPITPSINTSEVLHIVDYRADQAYLSQDPLAVAGVEMGGIRSLLVVPMVKDSCCSGQSEFFTKKSDHSMRSRLHSLRASPVRPLSLSRMRGLLDELRGISSAADGDRRRTQGDQPLDLRSTGSARHVGHIGRASLPADRELSGLPGTEFTTALPVTAFRRSTSNI